MAVASGIGAQVGIAPESVYGTFVAPTKFIPADKFDVKRKKDIAQGDMGMAAGRFGRLSSARVPTTKSAAGSLGVEVMNQRLGLLLQALMGNSSIAQQAATAAWLQTHTLGDPFGKSLSMQVGLPNAAGTVVAYSYTGCKVLGAEFSFEVGKEVEATFDIDAQNVTTAQALGTASYPTGLAPFVGTQTSIKIGATFGTEAVVSGVTKTSVSIKRPSATERYYFGAATSGTKAEPIINDFWDISGTISADFLDKTIFADRFEADTEFSLVLEAIGPIIASTYAQTFRITLPGCKFDGDTPTADGPDVISGDFPFTCNFDGTNLPKIEYMTTDVAY